MDSLIRIIGPAPSELPLNEFLSKLTVERDRVRRSLYWFQNNPQGKVKKPRKAKAKKMSTVAKKENLTPEQIAAAIAALKKERTSYEQITAVITALKKERTSYEQIADAIKERTS